MSERMPTTTWTTLWLAAATLCASILCASIHAQEPTPQPEPSEAVVAALTKTFADAGITFDAKAKTVTIDAVVNRPSDLIEFVLIHRRGKGHEAIFVTEVKPSLLNASLLALGWKPGRNAQAKDKDPMPSEAEIRAGAPTIDILPPEGERVWITVGWTPAPPDAGTPPKEAAPNDKAKDAATDAAKDTADAAPRPVRVAVEDLMIDLRTGAPVTDSKFVFLGGRMAPINRGDPEVFMADYEGNLVSSCYMHPPNHLITNVHERAADEQNWWVADAAPPPGTKVQITFHVAEPKEYAGREARARAEAVKVAKERARLEAEAKAQADKEKGDKPTPDNGDGP